MYLLFTTPGCHRCSEAKKKLQEGGYEFKEIDVTANEENVLLAEQYGVMIGGTVIDSETKEIIKL
ncbi:MAG TPA: hypothetical protein GX708_06065 [Gallicola sp.]|nr:hypothetical protein [Gallicola sp.]